MFVLSEVKDTGEVVMSGGGCSFTPQGSLLIVAKNRSSPVMLLGRDGVKIFLVIRLYS